MHTSEAAVSQIEDRLRELIVRALRLSKRPDEIQGLDLVSEFGVTSVDALEILINVEMEFGIEVPDEDLNQGLVASVQKLAKYVEGRVLSGSQAVGMAMEDRG